MSDYPPEPWFLGGRLLVSAFRVTAGEIPAFTIPDRRRPFRLFGKVVVGTAFVSYTPGGVLAYEELLVAIPSFGRGGFRVTITQIWVDSPASMAGGRELWGIPKQLATFTRADATTVTMGETASLASTLGGALLPGTRQLPLPTLQWFDGRRILSHNRIVGHLRRLRTRWTFGGELAWLATRKPIFSAAIVDASIVFGRKVERS